MRRATGAEVPSSGGCFKARKQPETARVSTALSSYAGRLGDPASGAAAINSPSRSRTVNHRKK
jgi:hypothetical protein